LNRFRKHIPSQKGHPRPWRDGTQLAKYAKYYSYGSTKISGGSEFIRKTNYSRRDFFNIGKQMLKINYTLNLGQLLKITLELKRYLWQKLKLETT
jgi:hypothetical protein